MKKTLLNIFILSALSSCSLYSNTKTPDLNYDKWIETDTVKKSELDKNWWKNFRDEKLDKIIDLASQNSKDLQIAIAIINQARASESEVLANSLPIVNLNTNAGRTKNSSNLTSRPITNKYNNNYKAQFDASWEISLFGIEPAERAASSLIEKTQEGYNNTLVTLYGDISTGYFDVRKYQLQLSLYTEKLEVLEEKLTLQTSLERVGKIDVLQLSQTQVEIFSARSAKENASNNLKQAKYKLTLLSGLKPGDLDHIIDDSYSYYIPRSELLIAAPQEVLANRPDIRLAQKNLNYNDALKDVAYTNLFPKISISGMLGFESGRAGNLLDGNSAAWNAAGGLLTPIFDYKKVHSDILEADSKSKEALANYEKSVLTALSDVESSIAAYKSASNDFDIISSQFESAQNEEKFANDKYEKGMISYLEYVDVKSRRLQNEISLEETKNQYLIQLVRVYKSLGGGW